MKFSAMAGTALVPTLSRLVLAAAFIALGAQKCFDDAVFPQAEAQKLQDAGISVNRIEDNPVVHAETAADVHLASFQDDQPTPGPDTDGVVPEDPPVQPPVVNVSTLPDGNYTATGMHTITVQLIDAGWSSPDLIAKLVSWAQLLGGGMLLIGLFSRLWGLLLAAAMGGALYLPFHLGTGTWEIIYLETVQDTTDFNRVFRQLGLLVLAFGIFLTGAGPISLDGRLFKRGGDGEDEDEDDVTLL